MGAKLIIPTQYGFTSTPSFSLLCCWLIHSNVSWVSRLLFSLYSVHGALSEKLFMPLMKLWDLYLLKSSCLKLVTLIDPSALIHHLTALLLKTHWSPTHWHPVVIYAARESLLSNPYGAGLIFSWLPKQIKIKLNLFSPPLFSLSQLIHVHCSPDTDTNLCVGPCATVQNLCKKD